ncbi:hypothetical protein QHJ03_000574 [Salmonella enterica]|uniref:hypothetical protein n=1 Tax=Salmonella enterica TaxID=28901 RepID=UPI00071CEF62|nr:hypothetical protein [Salmonella enterica]EBM9474320.1 hypothetical protein [Salmonella enterica subsp. enterica serovar Rubislaw]EBP4160081.1 hypothetical protein [Salmonella enterica subsp. enterica]ECT6469592.1 hypothetical protein [Salmonella enterica subsp. enterica serovar Senegal]EAQ5804280.1 hypothetical protein [Salmonella enterica]EBT5149456.1 hypothetical protein [Salmonella enterica]
MNNGSDDSQTLIAISFAAIGLVGLGISNFFGVPFLKGLEILPYLIGWAAVFGATMYFGFLKQVAPIALGTLWLCFRPILDYKAGIREDDFPFQPDIAWYGTGLWQFAVFAGIVILGYGFIYWLNNRY